MAHILEEEFLFSQYTVFTVKETRWSKTAVVDERNPHVIVLTAAIDKKYDELDLPLAPWSQLIGCSLGSAG